MHSMDASCGLSVLIVLVEFEKLGYSPEVLASYNGIISWVKEAKKSTHIFMS